MLGGCCNSRRRRLSPKSPLLAGLEISAILRATTGRLGGAAFRNKAHSRLHELIGAPAGLFEFRDIAQCLEIPHRHAAAVELDDFEPAKPIQRAVDA